MTIKTKNIFNIKIWGARGSHPTPGAEFTQFGGNTSCFEVRCGDQIFIFDAGSGFTRFSEDYHKRHIAHKSLLIFNSHPHFDHLVGIEQASVMFDPAIRKLFFGGSYRFNGGSYENIADPEEIYRAVFREPASPDLANLHIQSGLKFRQLQPFDQMVFGRDENRIIIKTHPLPHGNRITFGFRIEYQRQSLAILTDLAASQNADGSFQCAIDGIDHFVGGADLLLADAHFTAQDYKDRPYLREYGHATADSILALAAQSHVKKVIFSHHNPAATDKCLEEKQYHYKTAAQSLGLDAEFAREGHVYDVRTAAQCAPASAPQLNYI